MDGFSNWFSAINSNTFPFRIFVSVIVVIIIVVIVIVILCVFLLAL